MPRKQVGKKIDINGNLVDLGNTVSDEDLNNIDQIPNKLEKSNIKAGSNITLDINGNDITINSTSSSSDSSTIKSISVNGEQQPIINENVDISVPSIDGLATEKFVLDNVIKTLESPIRIWDLEDGLYKLLAGCVVYYRGATSETSFTIVNPSVLQISYANSTQLKGFNIFGHQGLTYYGYSSETTGSYGSSGLSNIPNLSPNTGTKAYLIGAGSKTWAGLSYTEDNVYMENGKLYSNGEEVVTQNSLDTANANINNLKSRVSTNETNISNLQNGKVDKIEGKGLSTNDYTTAEKNKLKSLNNYDDTALLNRVTSLETNKASIDFVNSSIATATATYRGSFDTLEELKSTEADNNDYAFLQDVDTQGNTVWKRYKYNGTEWVYEYTLNNSSFTAAQWATINSGVTKDTVTKVNSNTNSISILQDNKADKTELNNYFKYGTSNAPKADANDTVAMTNLFSNSGNQVGFTGIIAGDETAPILAMYSSINKASSVILSDSSGNTLQISSDGTIIETFGSTFSSGKIVNSSELAAVATTGSYNSLSNKPTIPTAISQLSQDATHRIVTDTQISTWNAKSNFSGSYNDLTNKPTIPTKTSQLTNDSNFLTSAPVTSVNGKTGVVQLTQDDVGDGITYKRVTATEKTTWNNKSNFSGSYNDLTNKPTIPTEYIKDIDVVEQGIDTTTGVRTTKLKIVDAQGNQTNAEYVSSIENATSNANGLMSVSDKNKLDNLPTEYPTTYLKSATKKLGQIISSIHNFKGTGIELYNQNNQVELSFTNWDSFGNATNSLAGLMSAEDKQKLDGILLGSIAEYTETGGTLGSNPTSWQGSVTIGNIIIKMGLGYLTPKSSEVTTKTINFKTPFPHKAVGGSVCGVSSASTLRTTNFNNDPSTTGVTVAIYRTNNTNTYYTWIVVGY